MMPASATASDANNGEAKAKSQQLVFEPEEGGTTNPSNIEEQRGTVVPPRVVRQVYQYLNAS